MPFEAAINKQLFYYVPVIAYSYVAYIVAMVIQGFLFTLLFLYLDNYHIEKVSRKTDNCTASNI